MPEDTVNPGVVPRTSYVRAPLCRRVRAALGVVIAFGMISVLGAAAAPAFAQEKIRIGILGQFSGPFAVVGKKYREGIESFTAVYGTRVGGREVEILYRDLGGSNPSVARRLGEELIVRDGVKLLGGFYLSPEPIALGPVLTETKTPAVVFNGAALAITQSSPMILRPAQTQHMIAAVQAEWAIKNGWKQAYLAASDYSPGHDFLASFRMKYAALGGEIIGEDKIPLNTVDYAPFVERLSKAKPPVYHMFIPVGAPSVNIMKALRAQGLTGRKDLAMIGQAIIDDPFLPLYDDSVVGMFDSLTYSMDAPGAENKKYKDAMKTKHPAELPSYEGACAYDGMMLLYQLIQSQQGKPFDGAAAVQASSAHKFEGARGPIAIEPETRNATMNVYLRRAIKGPDGKLKLEITDTFSAVKSIPAGTTK